jgi:hypothetical protein
MKVELHVFLISDYMQVSGPLHDITAFSPGESLSCSIDRKLGGPQILPGRGGEQKYHWLYLKLNLGYIASLVVSSPLGTREMKCVGLERDTCV